MPRKLRLSVHRKNEFRKKRALKLQAQSMAQPPQTLIVSIPLNALREARACSPNILGRRIGELSILPRDWLNVSTDEDHLLLSRIVKKDDVVEVKYTVTVSSSLDVIVRVQDKVVTLPTMPKKLFSVRGVVELITSLDLCNFCVGNEDERFTPLHTARKGIFVDQKGVAAAQCVRDYFPFLTIRSSLCHVLVLPTAQRCPACSEYRKTLNSLVARYRKVTDTDSTDPDSHTNYRYLNTPQKRKRMRHLHARVRANNQRVRRIKAKLENAAEKTGIEVDDPLHQDLIGIVSENSSHISSQHPDGSFPRLFWEQQEKASKVKNAKSMRWEPAMIRWCVYIRHLSSSAYEVLRDSGIVRLPSQRTLRDYTYHTASSPGFAAGVDQQLMELMKVDSCNVRDKYLVLIMDEMHIRQDIIYDKFTGAVTGFANLGDLNNHLRAYERTLDEDEGEDKDDDEKEDLAKTMLVLMVRGIFTKIQFAYAQFPCAAMSGYHLYDIFWEAVERLERCGLKVIACTCDGLSVNRNFFKLHGKKDDTVHKVLNPCSQEKRHVYFFVDPPHLMKTTRNCWQSRARLLWNDGKYITWSQLVNLYHKSHPASDSPGLSILPKLKYEHISLTSFSKMRVDLAVQVLSSSVSKGFELMHDPELEKTIEFTRMFDRLFDCLNVASLDAGKHTRNAFKSPYHSAKDFRITWLKEEFLGFLDRWESSVRARSGFNKTEQNKMLLSVETRTGLRLTVLSFIELVEYLFTIPGVSVFLSNRLCQDPLENFFGQQRQRGRVNENPNVSEFIKNTQALRVVNSDCATVRGNCRGAGKRKGEPPEIDNAPMKKRKTKHK